MKYKLEDIHGLFSQKFSEKNLTLILAILNENNHSAIYEIFPKMEKSSKPILYEPILTDEQMAYLKRYNKSSSFLGSLLSGLSIMVIPILGILISFVFFQQDLYIYRFMAFILGLMSLSLLIFFVRLNYDSINDHGKYPPTFPENWELLTNEKEKRSKKK